MDAKVQVRHAPAWSRETEASRSTASRFLHHVQLTSVAGSLELTRTDERGEIHGDCAVAAALWYSVANHLDLLAQQGSEHSVAGLA